MAKEVKWTPMYSYIVVSKDRSRKAVYALSMADAARQVRDVAFVKRSRAAHTELLCTLAIKAVIIEGDDNYGC